MIRQRKKNNVAQSMIEYTLVMTIVLTVMASMGTIIRRTSQGWTKFMADQIGVQNEADQQFNDITQGHLDSSYATARSDLNKQTLDVAGMINYIYDDVTDTDTNTVVNLGVNPDA